MKAVARFLDMDWKAVKRIDKQTLEKRLNSPNYDGLRRLRSTNWRSRRDIVA
ncbi:MAG: hypothetical protein AB1656_15765 [Candidatus Omnitrophota bacterium]